MYCFNSENSCLLEIKENVTSQNVAEFESAIDKIFNIDKELVLDCKEISLITSAGLRVILKAQKRMTNNKKVTLINVPPSIMEVLQMTGFVEIIKAFAALRKLDLQNLNSFARGGTGECYKLDDETLLKLYYDNVPQELIEFEKESAKEAFVAGIPTAISYDMVEVGNRKGIIYELLHAETLSQVVAANPDRLEELSKKYAQIAKLLHTTEATSNRFPNCFEQYYKLIKNCNYLSETAKNNVAYYLNSIPQAKTYVHGDFNPNNIMVSDGELMLIDMGEFSVGSPIYDVASLYFTFFCVDNFADDEVYSFTGLNGREQREIWHYFICEYFSVNSFEQALEKFPEANLINDIALIKAFRVVELFSDFFKPDWCESVRNKMQERFA